MGLFAATVELEYLGGHPELPKARKVTVRKEKAELVLDGGFLGPKVRIPLVQVKGLALGVDHKRSAGKAVAGAVIGGLLTGGIGALAGAAFGGRRRQDNTAVLTIDQDGVELSLLFGECNGDRYAKLASLLKR